LTRKLHFRTGAITTKLHTDPISETVFFAGRYPQKAAKEYLLLLDNLESNAEYKGMDLDRLKIVSAVVHKGTKLERFTPRAMGRASPKIDTLIHVELIAQERYSE
jgi:large subunit ribosomal protein L22